MSGLCRSLQGLASARPGRRRWNTIWLAVVVALAGVAPGSAGAASLATSAPPTFVKTLAGPSVATMYPSGVAWDAQLSRVVVPDTGNDRVEFYTESGVKLGQFGTFGTANGQFDSPRDAALDPSSNIYIADAGNNRIQKFDQAGSWIWTIGGLGTCHTCMNTPIGISWDAANNAVIVVSTGTSIIKAFDPNGNWLWTSPQPSNTGLASPRDATRGPDGRIWVADYKHHQVKAFNVTPAGVWTVAPAVVLGDGLTAGHGAGQLNFPYNADFSADGSTVYVADTGNNRIARWDISGATPVWLDPIGTKCVNPCLNPPASIGLLEHLRRVVVLSDGTLLGADFWGNGIDHYGADGTVLGEIEGVHAPVPGFAEAFGVAVGPDGTTYVVDRLNQRIERFDAAGTFINATGSRGTMPGSESWPEAIAVAPDLTVWEADTRNDRLQHYRADLTGTPTVVGSTGSASNQFNYIEGLTVDAAGKVWVADTRNNRIHVYDPIATTHTVFGTLGTGPGQFNNPMGVAVTASSVYVADTLNNRIQKLDLNGAYLASYSTGLNGPEGVTISSDGSVWAADTQNDRVVHLSADLSADLGDGFGSLGSGNTQFFNPHSLAVHGSTLFVADTYNSRVQEFTLIKPLGGGLTYERQQSDPAGVAPLYPAGGVADASGNQYIADSGGSRIVKVDSGGNISVVATNFNDPRDIVWDPDGIHLWVADTSHSQIVELATDGTQVHRFGSNGTAVAKYKTPYGLAVDTTGVYVADSYNGRIQKVSATNGTSIWSQTTCSSVAFTRPRGLGLGPDGNVYVADTDNNRIVELNPSSGTCLNTFGTKGSGNLQFSAPWAVLSDGAAGLWVADAMNYRVKHVTLSGAFISSFGVWGTSSGQFIAPHKLFMDGGLLDVADPYAFRVERLAIAGDGSLSYSGVIGGVGPAADGFNQPFAVAYGPSGEMYVVDWFNDRIVKFNPDGTVAFAWGAYGSKTGSFIFPRGIAVSPDGHTVVVTNSEDNRIDIFTSAGVFSKSIKSTAPAFNRPYQTALAADGTYWVADANNNRVLHLDGSGNVLLTLTNGGALRSPQGVALDGAGNVYVSDNGNNAVEKYSPSGTLIATLATAGIGPTNVSSPMELTISAAGDLLIADSGNHRIVVLTLSGSPETTFGVPGSGPGEFNSPHATAINPVTGEVAVADFTNNRISVWIP